MSFYGEKFQRNPLSGSQQLKIRKACFAIVGLGGTGGFILENLLRMGAASLIVFDNDRFELSNFNRQTLATEEFLDMPKVHAALARARAVDRDVTVRTFHEFGPGSDVDGAAVLLDGADNIKTKLSMARLARKKKIPYVFCSAQGSRGMVSVFTSYRFEKAFQLPDEPEALERYESCSSIMCPAASLAGSVAAMQAVNFLIGKPFVKAPNAIHFDLFREDMFWRARLG
jgi:molybdopterin/thiamine biosynthesis adenylyltransferase